MNEVSISQQENAIPVVKQSEVRVLPTAEKTSQFKSSTDRANQDTKAIKDIQAQLRKYMGEYYQIKQIRDSLKKLSTDTTGQTRQEKKQVENLQKELGKKEMEAESLGQKETPNKTSMIGEGIASDYTNIVTGVEKNVANIGKKAKTVEEALKPIDFDALARRTSRIQWKENQTQKVAEATQIEGKTLPESNKNYKIQSKVDLEQYKAARESQKVFEEKKTIKESAWHANKTKADLEAQRAILPPEHDLSKVLKNIGNRIAQAEKNMREQGRFERDELSSDYDLNITIRDNINAFTYKRGKNSFFEGGFITLFDQYLKEQKHLQGLSEDHLACLLGHEASHSDPGAKLGYLNEEYCDVQGAILTAEAGYNPQSMLDLEDFLISLEKGSELYKDINKANSKEKHAILSTHPPSENRKLTIINVLKNSEGSIPNQTNDYTYIDGQLIEDLSQKTKNWVETRQERVLPNTREEALNAIKSSTNFTELAEAMIGAEVLKQAELTKAFSENDQLVNLTTLTRAVTYEIKQALQEKDGELEFDHNSLKKEDIGSLVYNTHTYPQLDKYEHSDYLIGRQVKQLAKEKQLDDKIQSNVDSTVNTIFEDLKQLSPKVNISRKYIQHYDEQFKSKKFKGREPTTEEIKQAQDKADEENKTLTDELDNKVNKIYKLINHYEGKIDLPSVFSGDFSSCPQLKPMLKELGIPNFNNYLEDTLTNFQELDINQNLKQLMSERGKNIFLPSDKLAVSAEMLTKTDIEWLLEETKETRMFTFTDARTNKDLVDEQFVALLDTQVAEKIHQLVSNLSGSDQEKQLLEKIFNIKMSGEHFPSYGYDSTCVDLVCSTQRRGEDDYKQILEKFDSNLTDDFFNLRIKPSCGGNTLNDVFFADNQSTSGLNYRIRSGVIAEKFYREAEKIDFIRAYFGEGEYIKNPEDAGREWMNRYIFELKPRDTLDKIKLTEKRRTLIPTYNDKLIDESSSEKDLKVLELEQPDTEKKWNSLLQTAKASDYEVGHLEKLILFKDKPADIKAQNLLELVKEGEIDLDTLFKGLIVKRDAEKGGYDASQLLHKESGFDHTKIEKLKTSYQVAMNVLKLLPVSPALQKTDLSKFCDDLYQTKKIIAQTEKSFKKNAKYVDNSGYIDYVRQIDIFEGKNDQEKATKELNFIFDFVKEGGIVKINTLGDQYINWNGLTNEGADAYILSVIKRMNYPVETLKTKIDTVLKSNKHRYTEQEIDKWISLLGFCEQPGIYYSQYSYRTSDKSTVQVRLGNSNYFQDFDQKNLDHVLKIADEVEMIPTSTYKDFCLRQLFEYSEKAVGEEFYLKGHNDFIEHPGREILERRIISLLTKNISPIGLKTVPNLASNRQQLLQGNNVFIPRSEMYLTDALVGYYIGDSEAAQIFQSLIVPPKYYDMNSRIRNPLMSDYRDEQFFQNMSPAEVERRILQDRLILLQSMPESPLKEGLTLYSLRSAIEKTPNLKEFDPFKSELNDLIQKLSVEFKSNQGRQNIFDLALRLELKTGLESSYSPDLIKTRFNSRQEFLDYIFKFLPQKSTFRDGYLKTAVETYPLKIAEADDIRNLFFINDYRTTDERVTNERAGLEFLRSVKENKNITKKDLRELFMWLFDEDRQIKAVDSFFTNLKNNPAGLKLAKGLIKQIGWRVPGEEQEQEVGQEMTKKDKFKEKMGDKAVEVIISSLINAPSSVKKYLVKELFRWQSKENKGEQTAILFRTGMPNIIQKITEGNTLSSFIFGESTFNSLLESSTLDNPNRREIFFDLALGIKGILEEPVEQNSTTFKERLKSDFGQGEMHKFIDDIMEISFKKAKISSKDKNVARVVFHSFIEGLDPVRRADVMFNLLTKFSQLDLADPDPQKNQSQLLQAALSSIGVVGAKIGQIDELIPKGWGSELSSLKHSTKPLSKLTVADLFNQENLSGEYIIEGSAGAASTACGYIIQNPAGDHEFAKVVRPEVKIDWKKDFYAVKYMLECLKQTNLIKVNPGPIMNQIEKLVEEELKTQKEVDNVVQYVAAETVEEREKRGGIRAVEMPKTRTGKDGRPIEAKPGSLIILEELLPKNQYIELSKVKSTDNKNPELEEFKKSLDFDTVHEMIIRDFFHRAFNLGSWHSDLHDGNILISKDSGVTRVVSPKDLVLIDFGQTGTVKEENSKQNAAKFFMGLALRDRDLVAESLNAGLVDSSTLSFEQIKKELGFNPLKLQKATTEFMSTHEMSNYLTNFLKATVNVLPYLRPLPKDKQFGLISPYIGEIERNKLWIRVQEAIATKNYTRLFIN
ncbi:MAG: AarF/UbiB family protein [Candidatus Roizmanbacteria bacterium]